MSDVQMIEKDGERACCVPPAALSAMVREAVEDTDVTAAHALAVAEGDGTGFAAAKLKSLARA